MIPQNDAAGNRGTRPGLSRFFPWRTPRLGAKSPETLGEKVSGGCRGEGETFPWRPPAPARRARGTGRAGKLPRGPFAGLLALAECSPPRARRCAAGAAPQLASRGRLPSLSPVPRAPRPNAARPSGRSPWPLRPLAAAGPPRASIPRLGGRMRRMPAGLRPRRPAFAASPPASGLPIHRNLPAPPLALGDCGASARALGGLPGGVEETLRVPSSRTPAKRRGAPRTEAAAAIEEGGEGKGAAGGASPEGVRADARARGRRTRGRAPPDASPRRARAPRNARRAEPPAPDGRGPRWKAAGGAEHGSKGAAARPQAVHNGMQGDADGGRGQDWRLPATPAASHAPVWRGVAPAVFRAQNRAAEAGGAGAFRPKTPVSGR